MGRQSQSFYPRSLAALLCATLRRVSVSTDTVATYHGMKRKVEHYILLVESGGSYRLRALDEEHEGRRGKPLSITRSPIYCQRDILDDLQ